MFFMRHVPPCRLLVLLWYDNNDVIEAGFMFGGGQIFLEDISRKSSLEEVESGGALLR